MLTREENDLVTRVEGDAPAGRLMRRYWLPALLSSEVAEPGGTPVRVKLVGEQLVCFRNSAGVLAMVEEACPHRLASLALGRNEEGGLRCIYHGWKFGTDGRCMEMPTEPEEHGYREKMSIRSYPVWEGGGLVWCYLGPPELEPQKPAFDWTAKSAPELALVKFVEHTNYLQALEGSIDTAHSWFLHRGALRDWKHRSAISMDLSPRLEAEDTDYGFRYAAIRRTNADPDKFKYVKVTNVVFPVTTLVPRPADPGTYPIVQIFVPMDDATTMHYSVFFSLDGSAVDQEHIRELCNWYPGSTVDAQFNLDVTIENWWKQDRVGMKGESYTGIYGFPRQDVACQESMGAIVDRTREHLGTSDIAIIRMRRRIIENVRRIVAGQTPIGLDRHIDYPNLKSEQRVIPIDEPWQSIGAFAGEYAGKA